MTIFLIVILSCALGFVLALRFVVKPLQADLYKALSECNKLLRESIKERTESMLITDCYERLIEKYKIVSKELDSMKPYIDNSTITFYTLPQMPSPIKASTVKIFLGDLND